MWHSETPKEVSHYLHANEPQGTRFRTVWIHVNSGTRFSPGSTCMRSARGLFLRHRQPGIAVHAEAPDRVARLCRGKVYDRAELRARSASVGGGTRGPGAEADRLLRRLEARTGSRSPARSRRCPHQRTNRCIWLTGRTPAHRRHCAVQSEPLLGASPARSETRGQAQPRTADSEEQLLQHPGGGAGGSGQRP